MSIASDFAAPPPAVAAGLSVAGALGWCGQEELLERSNAGLRDPQIAHGAADRQVPTAMALALLRPLRLLGAQGRGPACVAELPFEHVYAAATALASLETERRGLRGWLVNSGLRAWTVDATAWERRIAACQRACAGAGVLDVAATCAGLYVVAASGTTVEGGPLDGATAIDILFEDASLVQVAVDRPQRIGRLFGARYAGCSRDQSQLLFSSREGNVQLRVAKPAGIRRQPSPLAMVPAPRR